MSGNLNNSQTDSNQPNDTSGSFWRRHRWIALSVVIGAVSLVLWIVVFYSFNLLPSVLLRFGAVIVAIVALLGWDARNVLRQARRGTRETIQSARWKAAILGIVIPGLTLVVVLLAISSVGFITAHSHGGTVGQTTPTISATGTASQTAVATSSTTSTTAGTTATATTGISVTPSPIFRLAEKAPTCPSSDGADWQAAKASPTKQACNGSFTQLTQTDGSAYAEEDLADINGHPYAAEPISLTIQLRFPNPGDTSTYAAIITTSPSPQASQCGGTVFAINSQGQTQFQVYSSDCREQPQVSAGQTVAHFDPTVTNVVEVTIQSGTLAARVDNQSVGSIQVDTSNSYIGIMVQHHISASSPVDFANLEFDIYS